MVSLEAGLRERANFARYVPGQRRGHYESYFQRANHPTRPLAFWIRYTIFSPRMRPDLALGELWAVYFDGETKTHVAAKSEFPFSQCSFSRDSFDVSVADSLLRPGSLHGSAGSGSDLIEWNLSYEGGQEPLFDLPLKYYDRRFPQAKALVGVPLASYSGTLTVKGRTVQVERWAGTQNHNWGSKHTDRYAWGQVAGFSGYPGSFLELATAQLKVGPLWTPSMTLMVLRHGGVEFRFNDPLKSFRRARLRYFGWDFQAASGATRVQGSISADADDFVCLRYYNPPGGIKYCLNTKIATCRLGLWLKGASQPEVLEARQRAAFEILTDRTDHGLSAAA